MLPMTDIYAKNKRSQIMSKISGKDTKPEMIVRKYLFAQGFRFRVNVKSLTGKPDIVLPKYKTIIFVNGCFWHGHKNCKAAKLPSTRKDFWKRKILTNIARDKKDIEKLRGIGWHVIIVWQCELSSKEKQQKRIKSLVAEIVSK